LPAGRQVRVPIPIAFQHSQKSFSILFFQQNIPYFQWTKLKPLTMHRRTFLQNTALTFGALTLANKNLLASFFEDPWKITMLTENLGIFTEKGGTIAFLLSKKGIVVVDSQFPDQSKHLIGELKKKTPKPFKLLINTHHHGDHTAGNIAFKGLVWSIVAHDNSKKNQRKSAIQNKSEDKQLYPNIVYLDTWNRKIGKERITLHYFGPAHTNGDSFVHFEHANIVHCGDLVFNRRHPYVDRGAGANIKSWIEVLNKGLTTFNDKTKFIYGHAGTGYEVTGSGDDLKAFRDYLGNVLEFVGNGIKAGKTKEDILKAKSIPGSDQWKGDGIERPLGAAWDELMAK
jgi:glyoxylase-like metal-dependent hydrolase (beta-lactamase superfamily II)